jgi:hypothetical protein
VRVCAFSLQKRGRPNRQRDDFVTGEEFEDEEEEEDFAEAERPAAPQRTKRKREASAAAAAAAEDLTLIGKRLLLSASVALASLQRGFGVCRVWVPAARVRPLSCGV